MKWLLLFLATPGSFLIVGLALRGLVRKIGREREADEDERRRKRFAAENHVPEEFVVAVPSVRRRPRVPAIRSDYRGFRQEIER